MTDVRVRLQTGAPPGGPPASPEGLDIFYQPVWRECELPAPGPEPAGRGTILVIGRHEDLGGAQWLQALHREARVVQATLGNASGDFAAVVAAAMPLDAVYFLGSRLGSGGDRQLGEALELGPLSLLRLLKALGGGRSPDAPVPLTVLASGAYAVDAGGREPLQPPAASLLGLAKVAARECPWLAVTCVDLGGEELRDFGGGVPEPLEWSLRSRQPGGVEVAFRRGKVWQRVLAPLGLAEPERRELPLRRGGAYLILGGGESGLEIAGQLTSLFRAGVVLVGPHASPEPAELRRLASLGERVLYCQGDAADGESLQRAVRLARERFGPLRGAFHAAAAGGRASLAEMDEAELRSGLGVKAQGSWNLYQATREEPLDFLLFFSSFEALFAGSNAAIEAAGGAFQDTFAAALARAGAGASRVKSIAWGPWAETRQAADPQTAERLREAGIYGLSTREGLSAWLRILAQPAQQVVALRASTRVLRAMERAPAPDRPHGAAGLLSSPSGLAAEHLRGPAADEVHRLTCIPVDAMIAPLDRFGELLVLRFLQSRGFLGAPGAEHPAAALESELAVAERHRRLFWAMLHHLYKGGWIEAGDDVVRATAQRHQELPEERRRLLETQPALEPLVRLLETCTEPVAEVLRDELPATFVLFPDGSTAQVENVYSSFPGTEPSNRVVRLALEKIVESSLGQGGGDPIRILEVGAGTGATTAGLLAGLQPFADRIEYHYTDLSRRFLDHGEKKFGARYPFLRFGLLNLDLDPRQQGWTPGAFQAVVATNVLHATADLRQTLRFLRQLLSPGGGLLIVEMTRASPFLTLTFGLLDGWWQHRDWSLRLPHSPLLSVGGWRALLAGEGFQPLAAFGIAREAVAEPPMAVLLAGREDSEKGRP